MTKPAQDSMARAMRTARRACHTLCAHLERRAPTSVALARDPALAERIDTYPQDHAIAEVFAIAEALGLVLTQFIEDNARQDS